MQMNPCSTALLFVAAMLSCSCHLPDHDRSTPPSLAVELGSTQALVLEDSFVHLVSSSATGRRYPLWVSVPASYSDGQKSYPVLFTTDAGYSFPIIRSIRDRVSQGGRNVEEFILVGLAPEEGLTSRQSRSRDYTPSNPLLKASYDRTEYTALLYGEADAYRDYLEQDIIPFVSRRYRTDGARRAYAGHSFGGLFGAYVLLTKPELFDAYILGSPSLWFDDNYIVETEKAFASLNSDLNARVALYIGALETVGSSPRNYRTTDMVGDMSDFARRLLTRQYPGLELTIETLDEEDHLTVYPALISRGLLWAFPGSGPYVPG